MDIQRGKAFFLFQYMNIHRSIIPLETFSRATPRSLLVILSEV